MRIFRTYCIFLFFITNFVQTMSFAQVESLRTKIEHIVGHAKGNIGVAIQGLENNDTITINGDGKFPMQSVYKFPLALAVLNQVEKGTLSLSQQIYLKKDDLRPYTWSPLREKYPNGNVGVTLDELLTFTVSASDNNGCDILFRLVGGTGIVNQYVHNLGITNIAIVADEEEMAKDWGIQYQNWSTPAAMGQLLNKFYRGQILSIKSEEYLMQLMVNTKTGPTRLKGLLPKETVVAHKTGSSGADDNGIAAATNDVGIVTLPHNRHFIIVVFVSNSTAEEKARDEVIANIAKIVWDFYLTK